MAKQWTKAQKFEKTNKSTLQVPVKHTRTGACTARGRCYHGKRAGTR